MRERSFETGEEEVWSSIFRWTLKDQASETVEERQQSELFDKSEFWSNANEFTHGNHQREWKEGEENSPKVELDELEEDIEDDEVHEGVVVESEEKEEANHPEEGQPHLRLISVNVTICPETPKFIDQQEELLHDQELHEEDCQVFKWSSQNKQKQLNQRHVSREDWQLWLRHLEEIVSFGYYLIAEIDWRSSNQTEQHIT